MQAIWRKTFELLRQYPALWWPVVLAGLGSICLGSLQQLIASSLVGKSSNPATPSFATLQFLEGAASIPVVFLIALSYSLALATIARKVRTIQDVNSSAAFIQDPDTDPEKFRRTLFFSLIVTLSSFASYVLAVVFPSVLLGPLLMLLFMTSLYSVILTLPFYLLLAYWLPPFALAFLQSRKRAEVPDQQRRKARIATLVAALANFAIQFAVTKLLVFTVRPSSIQITQTSVTTLLETFPCVTLFVALSLIASEDDANAEPSPAQAPVHG